jgi:LacI family transcriptional regulator
MEVITLERKTIYDVALGAKVSLATVSRVLNNPEKVKPETRDRVMKVIDKLGYRPNAIARGLASRKSTTVGVIVSDMTRASIAEMLGGICDIAKKYKYTIKLFSIGEFDDVNNVLKTVVAEQVDGVLYLNDELNDLEINQVVNTFKNDTTKIVFCNVASNYAEIPSVGIDYEKASYDVTKRAIDKGRKNVYMISTQRRYAVNDLKESGYIRAMKEHNLEPVILRTSGDTEINRPYFKEFFQNNKVDAAIAVRDSIAVSFLNIARELKYRIPEDICVSGFQNTKYASLSRPMLSCIDIPVYDIGAVSMRLLTKLMHGEEVKDFNIKLPHVFIERETL